jgi:hypothetical protein
MNNLATDQINRSKEVIMLVFLVLVVVTDAGRGFTQPLISTMGVLLR